MIKHTYTALIHYRDAQKSISFCATARDLHQWSALRQVTMLFYTTAWLMMCHVGFYIAWKYVNVCTNEVQSWEHTTLINLNFGVIIHFFGLKFTDLIWGTSLPARAYIQNRTLITGMFVWCSIISHYSEYNSLWTMLIIYYATMYFSMYLGFDNRNKQIPEK